jgi:hypothetical protein
MMFTLLRAVPPRYWIAVALVVLAGMWHWGEVRDAREEGRAQVRAEWDAMTARQLAASNKARAERDETTRQREAAMRKEIDHATLAIDRARADADRADRAAASLRDAARAAAGRCGAAGDTAAAPGSAPAGAGVLAEVLAELDDRAGALAAEADRRGIAGTACERAYDALISAAPSSR